MRNDSQLRENIKDSPDVAFHWIYEKHFSQLVDRVREFEEALSISRKMRLQQFSLKIATESTHSNQSGLCASA